jgi:hypothetical protein
MQRDIDTKTLNKILRLEFDEGLLFWRERTPDMFQGWGEQRQTPEWRCARWNKAYAGKLASAVDVQSGYVRVFIFGKHYYAHRIVWQMVNGAIPQGMMIDHINQDKSDNRIHNLRLVSNKQNTQNATRNPRNKSGVAGVFWDKRRGNWQAKIRANDKNIYLGAFNDLSEAAAARAEAEKKYGFHENHGRLKT